MLICLLLLKVFSVFHHDPFLCPSEYIGDTICDRGCMTEDSFYDSPFNKPDSRMIFHSDCLPQCKSYNCTQALLNNSDCDPECNHWECGWDNGACGFCNYNCSKFNLLDLHLNDQCNNPYCYYDNGMEGWCSNGCYFEDMTSKVKVSECNVKNCSYQNGLWLEGANECSKGCSLIMLENSYCDEECNNEKCNWDNSHCLCSENCTTSLMNSQKCSVSSPCLTESCNFLDGACPICAQGCLNSSLGDGTCNVACNNEACEYDQGDCACAANCKSSFIDGVWEFVGGCSEFCLVESCLFNYGSCTDDKVLSLAVLYALTYRTYNKKLLIEFDDSCSLQTLISFNLTNNCSLESSCNDDKYLNCNGYPRVSEQMYEADCLRWSKGSCLIRAGRTYFRGEELISGQGKGDDKDGLGKYYEMIGTTVGKLNDIVGACIYWIKEGSYNRNSPLLIEVSTQISFYSALALAVSPYTKIRIKNEKNLYFVKNDKKFFYADENNPLEKNLGFEQFALVISGDDDERPVVEFMDQVKISTGNFRELIFNNVEFSGKYSLDYDCDVDTCWYCPKILEFENNSKMDDRNDDIKDIGKYSVNCGDYNSYIPFDFSSKVSINNTIFSYFQMQPLHLIMTNSSLSINNSVFTRTQPKDKSSLISSTCSSSTLCKTTTLTIQNTSIIDFNYGYEHIDQMSQGYFLEAKTIQDISLIQLDFQYIMSISCESCESHSLIYFENIQGEILIQECKFKYVYVNYLIYINSLELVYNEENYDVYGVRKEFNQKHLRVIDCEFKNIYSQSCLIFYQLGSIKQNILMQDCRFEKVVAMKNGVLMVLGSSSYVVAESIGEWFYSVEGGIRSYFRNPRRTFELVNVTFEDLSMGDCLVLVINYPNVVIKQFWVLGITKPSINDPFDYVIKFFKDNHKYFSKSPSSSFFVIKEFLSVIYVNLFYYSYFENITISEVKLEQLDILDFSAIYADTAESNFTMKDYSFKLTKMNSDIGVALYCFMVKSFFGSGIEIERVENGYFGLITIDKTENVSMNGMTFRNSRTTYSSLIQVNLANKVEIEDVNLVSVDSYDSKGTILYALLNSNPTSVILNNIEILESNNMHGTGVLMYISIIPYNLNDFRN